MGYQFLRDWVEDRQYISDYMLAFKKILKDLYGEKKANKIEKLVCNISILLAIKQHDDARQKLIDSGSEIAEQLKLIEDNVLFTRQISNRKREINDKIKWLDTIINNHDMLIEEYNRRNNLLPPDKKIFSAKALVEQLVYERELEFEKIEKLNKLLLPKNFIKYKKELKTKEKYLKLLRISNLDNEIQKLILLLQVVFLECFENKLEYARTKLDVMQIIYEFRYYYLLFYNRELFMYEVPELQESINKTIRLIVDRAKLEGIIGEFSKNPALEIKIFREILSLRTINLEELYVEIFKEKETNNVVMITYDDEEFEDKLILGTADQIDKNQLGVKFHKRVRVFY